MILVGHSLGGTLAKHVGKQYEEANILAISAPGYYLSANEQSSFAMRIINIKPNRDIVPKVGEQEGIILTLPC